MGFPSYGLSELWAVGIEIRTRHQYGDVGYIPERKYTNSIINIFFYISTLLANITM